MKIVVDVKNLGKGFKKDDVLIYKDGYFIPISKSELLKEATKKFQTIADKYEEKYKDLCDEWNNFRIQHQENMQKLMPILESILKEKK